MKKLGTLESIKDSIKKVGQQDPIIKDALGLTIDGVKRQMLDLNLKEKVLGDVMSIEKHLELVKAYNPPPMTTAEKREYAAFLYKMYDEAKVPDMTIYRLIGIRLGCSLRTVQGLLGLEKTIGKIANVKTKKVVEPVENKVPGTRVSRIEMIDSLLNWLDREDPVITEKEARFLRALKETLNRIKISGEERNES